MIHAELAWKRMLGNFIDFIAGYLFKFLLLIRVIKVNRTDLSTLKPQNILVIRTDSMGDVVMSTPVYRAIKNKYPQAKVFALVRSGFCEVLMDNPNVDQIITHDVPWNKERSSLPVKLKVLFSIESLCYPIKLLRVVQLLRRQRFDLGIDLRGDMRNILFFLFACGVKHRLGFNHGGGEYLLTDFVEYDRQKNQIENNNCLLKKLGIYPKNDKIEIWISKREVEAVRGILKENGIRDRDQIVLLHPGGKMIQRWPAENFALLGKKLVAEFGVKLILTGTSQDLALREKISSVLNGNAVSLIGKTSICQLAALLSQNALLICNDTGVMHIASAMNCNTLAIFGPTSPRAFAHPNIEVIQKRLPCTLNTHEKCTQKHTLPGVCMSEMTVDFVYARARDFLNKNVTYI